MRDDDFPVGTRPDPLAGDEKFATPPAGGGRPSAAVRFRGCSFGYSFSHSVPSGRRLLRPVRFSSAGFARFLKDGLVLRALQSLAERRSVARLSAFISVCSGSQRYDKRIQKAR